MGFIFNEKKKNVHYGGCVQGSSIKLVCRRLYHLSQDLYIIGFHKDGVYRSGRACDVTRGACFVASLFELAVVAGCAAVRKIKFLSLVISFFFFPEIL